MVEEGATVVAVSDSTSGIRNMAGLDIARVINWKKEHGTVKGFPGAEDISNAEVLETECDVLIPAALENQITARNAERIKAKIVAEAANGPTTPEADEILYERGVFMIPDILCNAGGVTVSYFEWVQDLNRDHWTEAEVNAKLKVIMVKAFERGPRPGRQGRGQHANGCVPARRPARGRRHRDARPLPVSPPPVTGPCTRRTARAPGPFRFRSGFARACATSARGQAGGRPARNPRGARSRVHSRGRPAGRSAS